jgi:hypothetical protein
MQDVGIPMLRPFGLFCGQLVYFVASWSILWSFCIFYGHFVYFSSFWCFVLRKIWQPCSDEMARNICRTHFRRRLPPS